MSFEPKLADVRFGCGLHPRIAPPATADDVLARLTGPDQAAQAYPIDRYADFQQRVVLERQLAQARNESRTAQRDMRDLQREARLDERRWLAQTLLRRVVTTDGFRERLTAFWADHFTVVGKGGLLRFGAAPYVEDTIRPYVAGSFPEMLRAVARAPMMLLYLDQVRSVGPNSKGGRGRGVNENLAREMLELHTLGTGGPYTQQDVRDFALLLTGLSYHPDQGFVFRDNMAEPGPETVLGVSYGGDKASLDDIDAALQDLALHPATALHLAHKLAVHFVGDDPQAELVVAMANAYTAAKGDLVPMYAAMLDHPMAWDGQGNVKQPLDFIGSALRVLDIRDLPLRQSDKLGLLLQQPLALMGQPWTRPEGPDGWPEADEDWITPQRLAGRLQWALNVPRVLTRTLPDPRDLLPAALARPAPEALSFAARAAQTRAEGVALILSSPAFQRM
ncbi:DUF1800 family protein [Pseudooceanicola sp. MF1-13]|uniref:DUF1800 domain-containing protein n=1 Tax=Pseudooceanicola sp. MF1-13 TaxID=3379095 RepID=UPI003892AD62